MIYQGHVQDGRIVLDETVTLPEGAEVSIELRAAGEKAAQAPTAGEPRLTLAQILMRHAGKAVDLPSDAARNHDHYLYGTPKK